MRCTFAGFGEDEDLQATAWTGGQGGFGPQELPTGNLESTGQTAESSELYRVTSEKEAEALVHLRGERLDQLHEPLGNAERPLHLLLFAVRDVQ